MFIAARRRALGLLAAAGLLAALLAPAAPSHAQAQPAATVAAAATLKFALEEAAALFEARGGAPMRLVFGSSGNLHAQILQGAPFHLFMSADEDFVFRLAEAGRTADRGRIYAVGRIGLLLPPGSPLQPDGSLEDLRRALREGRVQRFAIANPEHAPYGMRAREALQHAGLWEALRPHLVFGENVSQAAQFATGGSTQGGIVSQSLALAPAVARSGRFALIPAEWHQPLRQRMVLTRDAPAAAREFYRFLATPEAQAVMKRYGFEMPAE